METRIMIALLLIGLLLFAICLIGFFLTLYAYVMSYSEANIQYKRIMIVVLCFLLLGCVASGVWVFNLAQKLIAVAVGA